MSSTASWLAFFMIYYGTLLVTGIGDPVVHGWTLVAIGGALFVLYAVLWIWDRRRGRRLFQ